METKALFLLEKEYDSTMKEINILRGRAEMLKNLIGTYKGEAVSSDMLEPKNKVPETFSKDLTVQEKVLYALSTLPRGGTAKEVAYTLTKLDNGIKPDKAPRIAAEHLSRLFNHKVISAVKAGIGRQYRYQVV